eukprot:TRINITY_DN244_c1_g1_i1.p1 TRINITY_DN244_c1_g1~~TRINITY_DN244_c1_g1_i1.p1  ORF type:complete len:1255 (+),score=406.75 TRINITY_DN244_c1_g1_i1:2037-5801(+)
MSNPKKWPKVLSWIQTLLPYNKIDPTQDLWTTLKDGIILIQVVNKIESNVVPYYHHSQKDTLHPLRERENLNLFLEACWKLGVPALFLPSDLNIKLNLDSVLNTLIYLSYLGSQRNRGHSIENWKPDDVEQEASVSIIEFYDIIARSDDTTPELKLALVEMVDEVVEELIHGDNPDKGVIQDLTQNAFAIDGVRRIFVQLLRETILSNQGPIVIPNSSFDTLGEVVSCLLCDLTIGNGGDYYTAKLLLNVSYYFTSEDGKYLYEFLKNPSVWSQNSDIFWEEFYWDQCATISDTMPLYAHEPYTESQRQHLYDFLCEHVRKMHQFGEFDEETIVTLMEGVDDHIRLSEDEAESILEFIDDSSPPELPSLFVYSNWPSDVPITSIPAPSIAPPSPTDMNASSDTLRDKIKQMQSENRDLLEELNHVNSLLHSRDEEIKEHENELVEVYSSLTEHKTKIENLEELIAQMKHSEDEHFVVPEFSGLTVDEFSVSFKGHLQRIHNMMHKCVRGMNAPPRVRKDRSIALKNLGEKLMNESINSLAKLEDEAMKEEFLTLAEDFREALSFFYESSVDEEGTNFQDWEEIATEVKDVFNDFGTLYEACVQSLKLQSETKQKLFVQQLTDDNNMLKSKNKALSEQNNQLTHKVDELTAYMDSQKTEKLNVLTNLQKRIEELETLLNTARNDNMSMTDKITKYELDLKKKDKIISNLEKVGSRTHKKPQRSETLSDLFRDPSMPPPSARMRTISVQSLATLPSEESKPMTPRRVDKSMKRVNSQVLMTLNQLAPVMRQKAISIGSKGTTETTGENKKLRHRASLLLTRPPTVEEAFVEAPLTARSFKSAHERRKGGLSRAASEMLPEIYRKTWSGPALNPPPPPPPPMQAPGLDVNGSFEKFVIWMPDRQMSSFLYSPEVKLKSLVEKVQDKRPHLSFDKYVITDMNGVPVDLNLTLKSLPKAVAFTEKKNAKPVPKGSMAPPPPPHLPPPPPPLVPNIPPPPNSNPPSLTGSNKPMVPPIGLPPIPSQPPPPMKKDPTPIPPPLSIPTSLPPISAVSTGSQSARNPANWRTAPPPPQLTKSASSSKLNVPSVTVTAPSSSSSSSSSQPSVPSVIVSTPSTQVPLINLSSILSASAPSTLHNSIPEDDGSPHQLSTSLPASTSTPSNQQQSNGLMKSHPSLNTLPEGNVNYMKDKLKGFQEKRASRRVSSSASALSARVLTEEITFDSLSDIQFVRYFKTTRYAFQNLPKWKQDNLKAQAGFL